MLKSYMLSNQNHVPPKLPELTQMQMLSKLQLLLWPSGNKPNSKQIKTAQGQEDAQGL